MDQEKFDDIRETLAAQAEDFAKRVRAFAETFQLPQLQARQALLAVAGLEQMRKKVRSLRAEAELPPDTDIDTLIHEMSLGQAFLAGGEKHLSRSIEKARQADFFSAFVAAVDVMTEITLAIDLLAGEERQARASRAASARHLVNAKRKDAARELYFSRDWRFKADAARVIEREFHVGYKTAERWITDWTRPESPSTE